MDNIYENNVLCSILDNLYDAVLIADHDCTVVYVNDAYTRVTGVTREDILHKNITTARPGSRMRAVVTSGKAELGFHRVNGERAWITNVVPIMENDTIIGGASISTDTADVLKISKKLEKSQRKLQNLEKQMAHVQVTRFSFDDIIAVSRISLEGKKFAAKLAPRDIAILIQGESGTGKEVYAQAVHNASPRRNAPFVAINCSAISPLLLESELFGYSEGAFTGAKKGGKPGLLETANGGTVFFDEIGDMDLQFQARLLRALQEEAVLPVGERKEKPIDVRILSATNKDLKAMVADGRFRLDLYYRIAPITLRLPPLRERSEDIPALIKFFLEREDVHSPGEPSLTEQAMNLLLHYNWPGNIRELANVIKTSSVLSDGMHIDIHDFPPYLQDYGVEANYVDIMSMKAVVRAAEREAIHKALLRYGKSTEGKRLAAKALGISMGSLYNKLGERENGGQFSTPQKPETTP